MIWYNLGAAPGQDSVSIFLRQNGGPPAPAAAHLAGGVLLGVPLSTGSCGPGHCAPWQSGWGVLLVALFVVAAAAAIRGLRRGADRVRQYGRLALAVAALITIVAYTRSPAAAHAPLESARYLSVLPVSLPAAIWPLCRFGQRLAGGRRARSIAVLLGMSALTAGTGVAATADLAASVPRISGAYHQQQQLIGALEARGATRLYADYWTCNRLAYASAERISCATVGDDLHPAWDRYGPLLDRVRAAPDPWYAFPAGSPVDTAFSRYLAGTGVPDRTWEVAGYRLHHPYRPVDVPTPPQTHAAARLSFD